MAYVKQTWNNGDPTTPITAARLAHIEDGVASAVPGFVFNFDGTLNATKRLHIRLTADGSDIEDLIVEDLT